MTNTRKIEYVGTIHKCPNCGEVLSALEITCPSCNFEIRDTAVTASMKEFANRLERAKDDQEKCEIIKNFPIPNDKENIWEFLIFAASNADGNVDDNIANAWLVKLRQVLRKAKILFEAKELKKIEEQYEEIISEIRKVKRVNTIRKIGSDMTEFVPILPQFIVIFCWILSIIFLLPRCRYNLDNSGMNNWQLVLALDFIVGIIIVPQALRCNAVLLKLETMTGLLFSFAAIYPRLSENLDKSGTNMFHLLLFFEVISVIGIWIRVAIHNFRRKEREKTSATYNVASFIIVLICLIIWFVIYKTGSNAVATQTNSDESLGYSIEEEDIERVVQESVEDALNSSDKYLKDLGIEVSEDIEKSEDDETEKKEYVELSIKYKVLRGKKAEITGFEGDGNRATIERKIDGYEVVSIGKAAFKDCITLESVMIWADLKKVDDYAFYGCASLQDISIPMETTEIGDHAFEDCKSLNHLLIWGNPDIGDYAFAGCEGLDSVSISNGTKKIGAHAFDGCTNLEHVIVWDDDTIVGKDAFANCPKLDHKNIQE